MAAGDKGSAWKRIISSERWDSTLLFVLTKALPVLGAIPVSLIWKFPTGRSWWIGLGLAAYGIAITIDAMLRLSERRRRGDAAAVALSDAQRRTTESICYAFTNVPGATARFFSQLRDGDARARHHLDAYFDVLLEHVTKVVTDRDVRVCLYLIAEREIGTSSSAESSVQEQSLLLVGNGHGRPDAPRSSFDGTTAHGAFVIQCMNSRRTILVEDTDAPPSEYILDCQGKGYRSFVGVPVVYNSDEYGMLMLDSPQVRGLTHEHEVIGQLFANFVSSGFHLMQSSPAGRPRLSGPGATVDSTERGGV